MPFVEVSLSVKAKPEVIYPVLKDMESYPLFMPDLVSVVVVERHPSGTVTDWVSNVDGRIIKWREEDIFDDQTMSVTYRQISGDLKKFEGDWTLTSANEETVIRLTVDFEFGIPMIAGLLNPLLKKKVRENSENMLRAIKDRLETRI